MFNQLKPKTMKTIKSLFLICLAMISLSFTYPQESVSNEEPIEYDQFCDGFEAGYKAGWCYEIFGCIEPITPLCPMPEINETSYKDGYNRGFLRALEERED